MKKPNTEIKTYPYGTTLLFDMRATTWKELNTQVEKMRRLAEKNGARMLFPTTVGIDQ